MSLVSIIIPTFNNPNDLKRAVTSVFNQQYKNIEIIIVDDGSSICYDVVINQLKQDTPFPLAYYKKTNAGPGIARQFGLDLAKGEYIQYLDSDDELEEDKITFQIATLNQYPEAVMTYGLSMVNRNPAFIHRAKHQRKILDDLVIGALKQRKWHTSACLWRYRKGKYWEDLYNGEDVLHDVNVGVQFKSQVVFTNQVVANINFDNSLYHLSNSALDKNKMSRLVRDNVELNIRLYDIVASNGWLSKGNYAEPLAERLLHTSCKLIGWGYVQEAKKLMEIGKSITKSTLKKIEFAEIELINNLPIASKNKILKFFFQVHRRINHPDIHQYRSL